VNFNYLLNEKKIKILCKGENLNECHWSPSGRIRATAGKNVNVSMYCKRCGCQEEIFLSEEQYNIQQKLITHEVSNV
jgi:hypothetical protein